METEQPKILVIGESPNTNLVAEHLQRKGLKVLIADTVSMRLSLAAGIAAMAAQEVAWAEPELPEYGDYRKFLPRKQRRW